MIKFEEFGKEVHAICCAFDGAERVGIAAIEALSDFAKRENDAVRNRPIFMLQEAREPASVIVMDEPPNIKSGKKVGGHDADNNDAFVKMVDVEVGATYLRRDGSKRTIVEFKPEGYDGAPMLVFGDGVEGAYTADGRWSMDDRKSVFDLVALIPNGPKRQERPIATEDNGVVTFHEPEGVEPFDQVGADTVRTDDDRNLMTEIPF